MPPLLRSRIALFALLGAFLIPIGVSSLRGLSHVLTCQEEAETPFSMVIPQRGDPLVTTSTRITRGQEEGVCGGLTLNMAARIVEGGKVAMVLPITNNTQYLWRGTVKLVVAGTSIPVDIGEIPAGETEADSVPLNLPPGTHSISGSLLIGP